MATSGVDTDLRGGGEPADPRRSAGLTDPMADEGPAAPEADAPGEPGEPGELAEPDEPGRRRATRGAINLAARGVGELLITAGVLVALFLGYQLWVTDLLQARTQARLHDKLTETWSEPATPAPAEPEELPPAVRPDPAPGEGFAVLRIPRFGDDYAPVIVEGVTDAALRDGPGHYPGTAMPGEIGNFVVSGHRTTYGKPFDRLDELKPGDPIVVEVQDRYYVYRMTRSEVVTPDRIDVIEPVPEQPGAAPTEAAITMTTCHPKFSAKNRLIVFGELDKTVMKTPGGAVPFQGGEV